MPKILVVTYSHTGTCRRLAQLLCEQQQWPMAEVSDLHPRSGVAGTWRCIADSLLRRRPAIRYAGPDPLGFDALVLVAPIWVSQLAGPMRSFVAARGTSLPPLGVVSVMGRVGGYNAVAEIARLAGKAPMLSTAILARSVDDGSCASLLQAFGDALRVAQAKSQAVRASMLSPEAA
jgi:multimeric flavodoxin WrbA